MTPYMLMFERDPVPDGYRVILAPFTMRVSSTGEEALLVHALDNEWDWTLTSPSEAPGGEGWTPVSFYAGLRLSVRPRSTT